MTEADYNEIINSNYSFKEYISGLFNGNNGLWVLGSTMPPMSVEIDDFKGGPAADILIVNRTAQRYMGTVTIFGFSGDDHITGTDSNEIINAGPGHDILIPGKGTDSVDGGEGADLVSYSLYKKPLNLVSQSETVSRASFPGQDSNSNDITQLENIETFELFGSSIVDLSRLKNTVYPFIVKTGAGSNIQGSKSNDVFMISFSENYSNKDDLVSKTTFINGNDGENTLMLDFTDQALEDQLMLKDIVGNRVRVTGVNSEHVYVDAEKIHLLNVTLSNGDDLIKELSGDDDIKIRIVADAGKGNDILKNIGHSNQIAGGSGNDTIIGGGGAGENTIEGNSGNDFIKCRSFGNNILSGRGDDIIIAHGGGNTINGGSGDDELVLKNGGNLIIIDKGSKIIGGFKPEHDKIMFSHIKQAVKLETVFSNKDLKKARENGDQIIVHQQDKPTIYYQNDDTIGYQKVAFSDAVLFLESAISFV